MKIIISNDELNLLKSRDLVSLKCENYNKIFYKSKNNVQIILNRLSLMFEPLPEMAGDRLYEIKTRKGKIKFYETNFDV